MKLRGRAGGSGGARTLGPLLQATGRLLGRLVAPAVLVALAVGRAGEVGELLRERALAGLRARVRQAVAAVTARKRASSPSEQFSASPSARIQYIAWRTSSRTLSVSSSPIAHQSFGKLLDRRNRRRLGREVEGRLAGALGFGEPLVERDDAGELEPLLLAKLPHGGKLGLVVDLV